MRRVMGNRAALGLIADRSSEAQAGLTVTTAQVRRATRARLDESEEAAIQNDAPAAPGAFADDTTLLLEGQDRRPQQFVRSTPCDDSVFAPFSPRSPVRSLTPLPFLFGFRQIEVTDAGCTRGLEIRSRIRQ